MANLTQQDQASEDRFELVLRIQQPRNGHSADAAAARSQAHALVKDIVRSRLDVAAEAGDEGYVHARGFTDLGKALAATRALQFAFEGFRSAVPTGQANISVVLDSWSPEDATAHIGLSVEHKDLLELAKPSQVLITQELYNKVAQGQLVALRSFPPLAGVYEFLWTNVERLDALRSETEFLPTPLIEPASAPDDQNTIIGPPVVDSPQSSPSERVRMSTALANPFVSDLGQKKHGRSRKRMLAIAGAAVIVSVGCSLGIWRAHVGNPTKAEVRTSPAAPIEPAITQKQPASPPSTPSRQDSPSTTLRPPASPADISPKPVSPRPAVHTDPNQKPGTHTCDVSIRDYLRYAENNANRGRYDDAKREYNQVLVCEPNNHEARQGLERTKEAERLN
jgi:hypothetical protein